MPKRVNPPTTRRAPAQPPGNLRPPTSEDTADVLARVYALILSWPTPEEKRAGQEGKPT